MRYTDPTGHCIKASGFLDTINCIASVAFSTISYIKDHPNEVLVKGKSFVLPVVIPKGFGRESIEIINTKISFKTIRTVGRLGEDTIPATFIAGGLLTVAPEQIENWNKGARPSEYLADAIIDGSGYIASEVVGDAFGAATAPIIGPWAIGVMVLSDAWAGNLFDNHTDNQRLFLQEMIEASQTHSSSPSGIIPVPAPHPPSIRTGTPTPY